jgi:hypothetical protein
MGAWIAFLSRPSRRASPVEHDRRFNAGAGFEPFPDNQGVNMQGHRGTRRALSITGGTVNLEQLIEFVSRIAAAEAIAAVKAYAAADSIEHATASDVKDAGSDQDGQTPRQPLSSTFTKPSTFPATRFKTTVTNGLHPCPQPPRKPAVARRPAPKAKRVPGRTTPMKHLARPVNRTAKPAPKFSPRPAPRVAPKLVVKPKGQFEPKE